MNPQAFVIALPNVPESCEAAARCIDSGASFGVSVAAFAACSPGEDPRSMFASLGWPTSAFDSNPYSRPEPCMACFLSHATLWARCLKDNEPIIILEHDAVFVRELPNLANEHGLVNLGRPSFGKFRQSSYGINPLFSKPHLPGAHGYFLHPSAARELIAAAKHHAEPTDVFLSLKRFRFLREAYRWPVECREDVTTIQREKGCTAKHRSVRII